MTNLFESGPLVYEDVAADIEAVTERASRRHYENKMVVKNSREMFDNVNILPDGRYYCCLCNRPYKTHATLTAHLRGYHLRNESSCDEPGCNFLSFTDQEKKRHRRTHDKKKKERNSQESMVIHEKIQKAVRRLDYPGEDELRDHLNGSTEVQGTIRTMTKKGKIRYACLKCPHSVFNAYHAARHVEMHNDFPKNCFYCGEIRKGTVDLQVHYMRVHKHEGIRTFKCSVCHLRFTTTILFRDHVECENGCQNPEIRQDIYYGELPEGTIVDDLTQDRLQNFRKRQEIWKTMGQMVEEHRTDVHEEIVGESSVQAGDTTVFDGSRAFIQTPFGLKTALEVKNTSRFCPRSGKRTSDDDLMITNKKRERLEMAPNLHFHQDIIHRLPTSTTTQRQNNAFQNEYLRPPVSYGYDPLIGRYPDFQLMSQSSLPSSSASSSSYDPFATAVYQDSDRNPMQPNDQHICDMNNVGAYETANFGLDNSSDLVVNEATIASNLMVNEVEDEVFEELNKLDFVMPADDGNDNDDDLEEVFNFGNVA